MQDVAVLNAEDQKAAIIAAFLCLSETASDAVLELVVEQVCISFVDAANRLTDRFQSYRAFGYHLLTISINEKIDVRFAAQFRPFVEVQR